MRRLLRSLLGFALGVGLGGASALWGCGGTEREPPPDAPAGARLLTFVEPSHGAIVPPRLGVRVVETGTPVVTELAGEALPLEVALFSDGRLVGKSRELTLEIELPEGPHLLEVQALRPDGFPEPTVEGDRIAITVRRGWPTPEVAPVERPGTLGP